MSRSIDTNNSNSNNSQIIRSNNSTTINLNLNLNPTVESSPQQQQQQQQDSWINLRSDPNLRWLLFSPKSQHHQPQPILIDPSSSTSMPSHDGRGRFSSTSQSSSSSSSSNSATDHHHQEQDDQLPGSTNPSNQRSRSSSSSWVHHPHHPTSLNSSQPHLLDLSSSDNDDPDELLSISSSISLNESLLGSRCSSLSNPSQSSQHYQTSLPDSQIPPVRELGSETHNGVQIISSVINSSRSRSKSRSSETRSHSQLSRNRKLSVNSSSSLKSSCKIERRRRSNSLFPSRSSSSEPSSNFAQNLKLRLSRSDDEREGEVDDDQTVWNRFRGGQSAIRFLNRVATRIMDVDEETMVLISDTEKLDRSIQDTSTLSSQSSLSTISCTSTTGNETRERIGRDNRIRRKLELLIRDKESFNRSQESLDESNDLMDLSSYYCSHPLRESYLAYSDSEGSCSESSDGLEEMRSSILTIRPSRPRIFPPTDNLDESTKEDGSDEMRRNEEDYEGSVSPGHKDHDDFLDGSTNRLRNVLNRVFDQLTVW